VSSDLVTIVQIVQACLTVCVAVYVAVSDRQRARAQQLTELREQHDARLRVLETAMTKVGVQMAHMPTSAELGQLSTSMAELRVELKTTPQRLDHIVLRLDRIEEFLHGRRAAAGAT
jgi:seryl-tRNA synthetase